MDLALACDMTFFSSHNCWPMVVVADPVAMDPAVMLAVPAEAAALVANPHPLGLSCSFVDVLCFNMTSQIVFSINFFFLHFEHSKLLSSPFE